MKRVCEPELMEDAEQARAYAEADFSEPNSLFLDGVRALCPGVEGPLRVLDLGCGPGEIALRVARAYPDAQIDAVDGSAAMLAHARDALAGEPGLDGRVRLLHARLPTPRLPHDHYDVVLSNSLLHHLPDPSVLWQTIRACARPSARVLVMDLMRPQGEIAVDALVESYALDAPEVLRRDFRASLCAAFTVDEVIAQLRAAGLDGLEVAVVSDRHLQVRGLLWNHGRR